MRKMLRTVLIGLLSLSMTSCAWLGCRKKLIYDKPLPEGELALRRLTDPKDYPDFATGFKNRAGLIEAIDHSLEYYHKPSSKEHYPYNVTPPITHERAVRTLETFKQVLAEARDAHDLHRLICERFDVYISVGCDNKGTVLFTGYCTPIFDGSRTRTGEFQHPLYKQPPDLEKKPDGTPVGRRLPTGDIVPYYTRRDIESRQLLAGKGLDLVWLRDPLEAYITHVQGSAIIKLPDGSELPIGYAGKTDGKYRSMGRALVADKRIASEDMSLQSIMAYFRQHPRELRPYMYKNDCYVFFTAREATDRRPRGSLNATVTPYRTIATDKAVFPRGLLAYALTKVPQLDTKVRGKVTIEPFYSFCLDQDTGSAIRAAGRCDVYMGIGDDALLLAGRTKAEGKLYYLAVK